MADKKGLFPVLITGFASIIAGCDGPIPSIKPNVIIILADDMGWGDINANGP